jgi:hypothetical protein
VLDAIFSWFANLTTLQELRLYIVTFFGAGAMYMFQLHKGFDGAKPFLRSFFPSRTEVYYIRVDFFLVTVVGSIIGSILYQPQQLYQALAAGFGWVGALQILLSHKGMPGSPVRQLAELENVARPPS